MTKFRAVALAAFLTATAMSGVAIAQSAIEVGVGHAALVKLTHSARSVVVGDPTVADVSVEGPNRVVVFGKRPGGTSLTVLGSGSKVLIETEVVVHPGGTGGVTVTYGTGKDIEPGGRTVVYACGATCVRTVEDKTAPAAAKPAE
jgi:Flp pilus assembly secretin CpaC